MSEFHSLRWTNPTHDSFIKIPEKLSQIPKLDWHQNANLVVEHFQRGQVLQVPKSILLPELEQLLQLCGKRFAVVIDHQESVVGLLQARDFHSRHTGALCQLLQLTWNELSAGHIMHAAQRIPVLTEQQVTQARIGDIAATMQATGRDFIWVTQDDKVIGVISSLTIMAITGESVRLYPKADSFAEIFHALKHPEILND